MNVKGEVFQRKGAMHGVKMKEEIMRTEDVAERAENPRKESEPWERVEECEKDVGHGKRGGTWEEETIL